MGNQCDCATLFSNKDMSKTNLNKPLKRDPNQNYNALHTESSQKYFPDTLSPAVNNAPPEGNEKIELFLSIKFPQSSSSTLNLKVNTFFERVGTFYPVSQTEVVSKTTPVCQFTKSIIVEYFFELKQRFKFEIVEGSNPERQVSLGNLIVNVSEVLGNKMMKKSFPIRLQGLRDVPQAEFTIRAEKVIEDLSHGNFEIKGYDFGNYEKTLKISNPTYQLNIRLCRMIADMGYVTVYQSEGKGISNGRVNWRNFDILLRKLCNMDYNRPCKVVVLDGDVMIGEAIFTLNDLGKGDKRDFKLFNPFLKVKIGTISFHQLIIKEIPSFLDYIKGGLRLNAMLAIDFTGSNGDPSDPDSLHCTYPNDEKLNEYQRAIKSVCEIILDYDYDKKIPLYGFGARREKKNFVEHCFPLNGNEKDPDVNGLDEILSTYKGPTLFTPIMLKAIEEAEKIKKSDDQNYLILMILTDGQIHDMATTINCLLKAAYLPLSVIIVGVGKADFSQMVILDGDDGLETESGEKCTRDLVQFVAFRDFQGIGEMLAKSVLEEIPSQVVEYFTNQGIKPNLAVNYAPEVADFNSEPLYPVEQPNVFEEIVKERTDSKVAAEMQQDEDDKKLNYAKVPSERLDDEDSN